LPLLVQACVPPSAVHALAASKQIERTHDHSKCIAGVEICGLDHRANRHTFAAAGAGAKDIAQPVAQVREKRKAAGLRQTHAHPRRAWFSITIVVRRRRLADAVRALQECGTVQDGVNDPGIATTA